MKAAYREHYGDALTVREVAEPVARPNEILIKVHATTVNRTDCAVMTGKPFIMRFFTGLVKPTSPIPGTDFAGEVVAVGNKVSLLPGRRVFGFNDQGLASRQICRSKRAAGNCRDTAERELSSSGGKPRSCALCV